MFASMFRSPLWRGNLQRPTHDEGERPPKRARTDSDTTSDSVISERSNPDSGFVSQILPYVGSELAKLPSNEIDILRLGRDVSSQDLEMLASN